MVRAFSIVGVLLFSASACAARDVNEHPLAPLIRFSRNRLKSLDDEIRDYTCTFVKRERIDGRLGEHEHIFVKLRHERVVDGKVAVPFSVYLRYLAPGKLKDREVIYVHGRNRGKVIVWRGGPRLAYVTTAVLPESDLAMRSARYPITEIGMKTLTRRLLGMGKKELARNDCQVQYIEGAKINGRSCLMVQITHPVKRDDVRYHVARIFIDDVLKLPVRYACYDWPKTEGEPARLIEEYSYVDVKLNVGLCDRDFDYRNAAYRFRKTFEP